MKTAEYKEARKQWQELQSAITRLKRANRHGLSDDDQDRLEELESQATELHERLKRLKTAKSGPAIPDDIAALSDAALAERIATLNSEIDSRRAALKLVQAERSKRQHAISARRKLEKLTPEERAAMQGIGPDGIESGEEILCGE